MAHPNQTLIDALLACPSISDKGRREAVIKDLPANTKHNITRDPTDKFDVRNIVEACQNYESGLQELIAIIEGYEGNSLSLQAVKRLVTSQPYPLQQVQLYVPGTPLSSERRSAIIDALAGLLKTSPQSITIYSVREGSTIFDLGIPIDAAHRLRHLLQNNNAQLRLLKIKKVILTNGPNEVEEWSLQEGRYINPTDVTITPTSIPSGDIFNLSGNFQGTIINIKSTITGQEIRIPFQRPTPAEHFTGRKAELAQLLNDLQPGRVVTLCGPGGMGKSALAAEAIQRLTLENTPPKHFPDGIIWHNFHSQPQVDIALAHIATSLGIDPRPSPLTAAQQALAGRRVLLLLDGTENADRLPDILRIVDMCGVLVTSRKRQDAKAQRQDIEPLETGEAIELLQAWGKKQASDKAAVGRICKLVGGLPLAVRLVGRYLDQTGEAAKEYVKWLETTPIRALAQGKHKEDSVVVLLERSLEQVSKDARNLLGVVGRLALAGFGVEPVVVALGFEERATRILVGELVSYGLLLRGETRYEVSHALVHTYAYKRVAVADKVMGRLVAYYTKLVKTESEKKIKGYRRLDAELPHLMRVLTGCIEREEWKEARSLAKSVNRFLNMWGHWTKWQTTLEFGLKSTQKLGDLKNEGYFLEYMGIAYANLGYVEQSIGYFKQALDIAQKIGSLHDKGSRLNKLGEAYRVRGKFKEAIDNYEQGLAIAQEINHQPLEGDILGGLGMVYSFLEQTEKSTDYYKQALTIARKIRRQRRKGILLGRLGDNYRKLGQLEKAIEYCHKALRIAHRIGDRRNEENWLGTLGDSYHNLGQMGKAIEYQEQGLSIAREIGHRRGEEYRLGSLGNIYRDLGQVNEALNCHKQALAISREIGDRGGEVYRLSDLGSNYLALGHVEQAIEYYEQTLAISREVGHRRMEGNSLGNLGDTYRDLGQIEQAIAYYQQALTISREIGYRQGEGIWSGNLGTAYNNLGQVEKAVEYQEQALTISREIGDRRNEGAWLGNLADAYRQLNQPKQALKYAQEGLLIARQIKDPNNEAYCLWYLGQIYQSLGDVAQARDYGQQSVAIFEALKFPQADEVREWMNQLIVDS